MCYCFSSGASIAVWHFDNPFEEVEAGCILFVECQVSSVRYIMFIFLLMLLVGYVVMIVLFFYSHLPYIVFQNVVT